MDAFTIDTDGKVDEVFPENGTDFKFKEVYRMIDCTTIQIFKTREDQFILADEDGKANKKPYNPKATIFAILRPGDHVVGKVLICKQSMIK